MQYIFFIIAVLVFSIFVFFIPPELFQSSPFRIIRQLQSIWMEAQFVEFFVALMVISSLVNQLCDRQNTPPEKPKDLEEPVMSDLSDPLLPQQETYPEIIPTPPLPNQKKEKVVVVPIYTDINSTQESEGIPISVIPVDQYEGEEILYVAPAQELY